MVNDHNLIMDKDNEGLTLGKGGPDLINPKEGCVPINDCNKEST